MIAKQGIPMVSDNAQSMIDGTHPMGLTVDNGITGLVGIINTLAQTGFSQEAVAATSEDPGLGSLDTVINFAAQFAHKQPTPQR